MNTNTDNGNYLTLHEISRKMCVPLGTLRVKLHLASKLGLELPPRRRIGKAFIYDVSAFSQWLWEHSETLRRPFVKGKESSDVE